jgi:hypothetical protein
MKRNSNWRGPSEVRDGGGAALGDGSLLSAAFRFITGLADAKTERSLRCFRPPVSGDEGLSS